MFVKPISRSGLGIGEARGHHMTMQHPQLFFCCSCSSGTSGTRWTADPSVWGRGLLGLGKGLTMGLSWILGLVEYEPVRPCAGVGLLASVLSGHSRDLSFSFSAVFFWGDSGGFKKPSSLRGLNSLS